MSDRPVSRRRAGSVTVGRPPDALGVPGSDIREVVAALRPLRSRRAVAGFIGSFLVCGGFAPPALVAWVLWRMAPLQHAADGRERRWQRRVRRWALPVAALLLFAGGPGFVWSLGTSGVLGHLGPTLPLLMVVAASLAATTGAGLHAATRHVAGLVGETAPATRAFSRARAALVGKVALAALVGGLGLLWLGGAPLGEAADPVFALIAVFESLFSIAVPALVFVGGHRLASLPVPLLEDARSGRRVERWLHALRKRGLSSQRTAVGWALEGTIEGRPVLVDLDLARHPARLIVEVHAPALAAVAPGLEIRAGGQGEGAVALPDPILGRLLSVDGDARGGALLAERHGEVLDVVRAHPGSYVADGRVVLLGPCAPADEADTTELPVLVDKARALAAALDDGARQLAGGVG